LDEILWHKVNNKYNFCPYSATNLIVAQDMFHISYFLSPNNCPNLILYFKILFHALPQGRFLEILTVYIANEDSLFSK